MKKYTVFAGLHEEKNEGWIWTNDDKFKSGDYVQIKNKHQMIICQVRKIDKNFVNYYNDRLTTKKITKNDEIPLVVTKYYRDKLDLKTGETDQLQIVKANDWPNKIKAMLTHPNDVVKISMYLALLSSLLGTLGLILGIFSILT